MTVSGQTTTRQERQSHHLDQKRQAHPRHGIDASGLQPALLVEGELAAQEEILSFNRPLGSDRNQRQAEKVGQQQQNDPSEGDHACIMPSQRGGWST